MGQRADPPGPYSGAQQRYGVASVEQIAPSAPDPRLDWSQYLDIPEESRAGISCSGGGIRSASYCLGALQELRRRGWLGRAKYLSCVSGGGYIAVAHEVIVSESLGPPADSDPDPCADPASGIFSKSSPYAVGAPEEGHLRSHLDYVAPGGVGKVWLVFNLVGGMVRHLLPFAAVVSVVAWVTGMSMTRWIGPSLRGPDPSISLTPFVWLTVGMGAFAGVFLVARMTFQTRKNPNDEALRVLQGWALLWLASAGVAGFFLVVVPAGLLLLHTRPFDVHRVGKAISAVIGESGLLTVVLVGARRMRRGTLKSFGTVVTLVATPLAILLPFLGSTYWVAQTGVALRSGPTYVLGASVGLLILFTFTNEVTSLPHLYYRERLATAFIGRRTRGPFETIRYDQPPWSEPILLSNLVRCSEGPASLPNLVVCANVDLSDVVPIGRGGASITFESDFVGGPVTGYVRTPSMEKRAKEGTLTLPALMAISGAAVSPSMGKMTRPGLRFVMALFDLRLGVWLPNPRREGDWDRFSPLDVWAERRREDLAAAQIEQSTEVASVSPDKAFRRPGMKYVFYEALGKNSITDKHVYVSDGGHWENLGLVELLRRGCGKIVCLDAAGDDIHHFNTFSEAIDLAHADLGVEFDVDMGPLIPDAGTGRSASCHVTGSFTYPNGAVGTILFVKAAICDQAPVEIVSYRERDPAFPSHPTSDQFFTELTFESYRTLGEHAVREAFDGEGAL